jgi:hypothetical protein
MPKPLEAWLLGWLAAVVTLRKYWPASGEAMVCSDTHRLSVVLSPAPKVWVFSTGLSLLSKGVLSTSSRV